MGEGDVLQRGRTERDWRRSCAAGVVSTMLRSAATLVSRLWAEQFVLYPAESALAFPVCRSEFSPRIIGASSRCSAAAGRPTVVVAVARPSTTPKLVHAKLGTAAFCLHVKHGRLFGLASTRARLLVSFLSFWASALGSRPLALPLRKLVTVFHGSNPFVLSTTQCCLLMLRVLSVSPTPRACAALDPSRWRSTRRRRQRETRR